MTDLTKARFGFLTAQLIGFTLAGVVASRCIPLVRSHLATFCGALGAIGLVEAFLRRVRRPVSERAVRRKDAAADWAPAKHPFAPVLNLSSTGIVTVIAALAIYLLAPAANRIPSRAPTVGAQESAPVVFPTLELEGLIHSGEHSTAIIQGCTVGVGDYIEGVRVVAITQEGVTLESAGQRTVLRWEDID